MSFVRCYRDAAGKEGSHPLRFDIYDDPLVAAIAAVVDGMLRDTHIGAYIDQEKIKDALYLFESARKTLFSSKVSRMLGWENPTEMRERGDASIIDTDMFKPSLHPLGNLIEAAVKAASGQTSPAPLNTVDGRIWTQPRRFVVRIPELRIFIDEAEMTAEIDRLMAQVRKNRTSLSSIMNSVMNRRDLQEDEARALMEKKLRETISRGSASPKGVGRIAASVIEVVTSNHAIGTRVSRAVQEREDADANSIKTAIAARLRNKLANTLSWRNGDKVDVEILSGEAQFSQSA